MEAEGHNKGEAHGRKVKDPLGDDEADGEEKVGGRNEGEDEPSNGHHQLPAQGMHLRKTSILGIKAHLERGFPVLRVANTR